MAQTSPAAGGAGGPVVELGGSAAVCRLQRWSLGCARRPAAPPPPTEARRPMGTRGGCSGSASPAKSRTAAAAWVLEEAEGRNGGEGEGPGRRKSSRAPATEVQPWEMEGARGARRRGLGSCWWRGGARYLLI